MKSTLISLIIYSLFFTPISWAQVNPPKLHPATDSISKLIAVSGVATGFNDYYAAKKKQGDKNAKRINRPNGNVDFALIIPSFSKSYLVNFNINDIISPKSEIIKIAGQKIEIPSNLSIPRQVEKYSIVRINLNKPKFTTFVSKKSKYKFTALHGAFNVKNVVDKLRSGRPIFDLINDFNFLGGGQIETSVIDKTEDQEINILGFELSENITVSAPDYDQSEFIMYSLALEENLNLINPTDVKFVKPMEKVKLVTNRTKNKKYAMNILTEQIKQYKDTSDVADDESNIYQARFDKFSLSLESARSEVAPLFLEFIEAPLLTDNLLKFSPPGLVSGIFPMATIVELIAGKRFKNGKIISEIKTSLWKTTIPDWKKSINLPNIDLSLYTDQEIRWEVSFVASGNIKPSSESEKLNFDNFTHVTKNYLVIK